MIYTKANVVDADTCKQLIEYFDTHPEQLRKTEDLAQSDFDGMIMNPYNVSNPELLKKLEVLRTKLTVEMSKLYHTTLYLDYWDLVKWGEGGWMDFHADNVDQERKPHWYCGWRSHSAIVYLNQEFEGGETVFRDQNVNIFPETGKALMFPAGFDYTHGVNEVDNNRYTLSLWFTEDPEHQLI